MKYVKKANSIIRALIFIVILGVLVSNVSYLLRPSFSLDESNEKREYYGLFAEEKDKLDVVFFGSSDIFVSFIPYKVWEDYGITSYSWGRSAMRSPFFTEEYKILSKQQKPELLVVGVRPFVFTEESVEEVSLRNISDLLPYSSPERFRIINDTLPYLDFEDSYYRDKCPIERSIPFYFDIMKYHENWQDINKDSWNFFCKGEFSSPTKGFLAVKKHAPIKGPERTDIYQKDNIEDYSEESLFEFLKALDKDRQKALFVMIPYHETAKHKKQYNYVRDIIVRNGYPCIDLNDYWTEIGMDETADFYDNNHPNIYGAEKITKYLMSYINDEYNIASHKGEEGYEHWDEELPAWQAVENDTKAYIEEMRAR